MKPCLIIFIKNPEKGKVKTRLAKDIGEDKALDVYKKLLNHTRSVTEKLECTKHLFYSSFIDDKDKWQSNIYDKKVQAGNDLGEKMSDAFKQAFDNQHAPVCIIGSDCFDITEDIIIEAFEKLSKHDYVIGPATDGGFYLLGMNAFTPQLFEGKTYSTSQVCSDAIEEINKLNRTFYRLPILSDVDTVVDLNF